MRARLVPALSLRLRLTIFYSLILGAVLTLFAVSVSVMLTRALYGEIDRSIADRARQVSGLVRLEGWPQQRQRIELPRPDVFASAGIFVQIVGLDGEVWTASDNLGGQLLPLPPGGPRTVAAGSAAFSTIEVEGEHLRVYSAPLIVGERTVGLVQVGRTLTPVEDTLSRLRLLLSLGVIICLGVSTVVGGLLAHTALAPLEHVTRTAESIGHARDFGQRVQHRGPLDEIGRLARTFNAMLERLESAYGELRSAYGQVEESLAAQRRFVADASHELRTPLTTVLGNASLLQQVEEMEPEDRRASVAQIHTEAERMSRLVQDLLSLARLDARQTSQRRTVDLRALVDEVIAQGRLLADGVELRADEVAAARVEGDRDHLKQLLLILVDNALKYTRPGGLVSLSLRLADCGVELLVRDTGAGIARRDLPHIFDRFYRGDRARKAGSTGLGLAIARRIAQEHGGQITVHSELGRGSTFVVRLPVQSPGSHVLGG